MPIHLETHRRSRIGWLRAAILGADDGIVSTASLMLGVAASSASRNAIAVAGAAGLVAGALSMAAGEYLSVSSQRDAERADIARERLEQAADPDYELDELSDIYVRRGLDRELARRVAQRLTETDALNAHLRDELGITQETRSRPVQAAVAGAASFAAGGGLSLTSMLLAPSGAREPVIAGVALALLASLGALGGRAGGASPRRAAVRVLLGGGAAMGLTAAIGAAVGTAV